MTERDVNPVTVAWSLVPRPCHGLQTQKHRLQLRSSTMQFKCLLSVHSLTGAFSCC